MLNKLDNAVLEAIEQYLGFRMPNDYRNFLLEYNGDVDLPPFFYFKKNDKNGSMLDSFFGIKKHTNDNILMNIKLYKNRIPTNCLPIANDAGSNLILLAVKNKDYGKVYFWDHNWEAEDGAIPDYSNLTLIADSFDEFINNLKSQDEIDAS